MPIRSGHPYLLGESSELGSMTMDPQQLVDRITAVQAQLANLTQTATQTGDRLGRVETRLENRSEHEGEHFGWYHIKDVMIPTFDGRHDQQVFLDLT